MLRVTAWTVMAALLLPLALVTVQSFSPTPSFQFPPSGFSLRWYWNVFSVGMFGAGLANSLYLAFASVLISGIVALASSYAIVRYRFFGRDLINAALMAPLIVPEIMMGLGLLIWILSLDLAPGLTNMTLLHCLVVIPYMARLITANLQRADPNIENAALLLGASPITAFVRVTLPTIRKGLTAAVIFALVMSMHNFTATFFLSSRIETLPISIYQYIRTEGDPTIAALSTLLIVGAGLIVWVTDKVAGVERAVGR